MHSLIPSTLGTTTGSLWRAKLHSPPSLLTNTFRHSDQAKHSRSCLGQLLQMPNMPSQRAPIATMPTFDCDGSSSPLLSSWPAQALTPSVQSLPGSPRGSLEMAPGCAPGTAPKPSHNSNWMYFLLTYPLDRKSVV